jgi:biotin carboxyl carrier protein
MMKNLKVTVNGTVYDVQVEEVEASAVSAPAAPKAAPAQQPAAPAAAPAPKAAAKQEAPAGSENIESPMPGTIAAVSVTAGQKVKKGDTLLVLEAMKMENEIMSPRNAEVAAVLVAKGDSVQSGTPLVSLR